MFFPDLSNIQIIESDFYNFRSDLTFDVVLCEATISLQNDPIGFLKKLSYFVKPSGILLITCHDHISILGDILFKIIGRMIIHVYLLMKIWLLMEMLIGMNPVLIL